MLVKSVLFFFSLCVLSSEAEPTTESSTNFLTNIMGSFRGPNAINITQFLSTFQMPACMKQCLPEIDDLLAALSKSNDTNDITSVCNELQASTHCASAAGCSKVFTEAAASAFQFVCLDNIQAISESMSCVKETAVDVQPECEAHCTVQTRIVDDDSKNSLEGMFEVPRLCNSTRCLLTCFKEKIDDKCRLGEKNLLDSLLSAVVRGEKHSLENALDWIMADSCQLHKGSNLTVDNSTTPTSVGQVPRPSLGKNGKHTRGDRLSPDDSSNPDLTNSKHEGENGKAVGSRENGEPMTVRIPPATTLSVNNLQPIEAALIIDDEVRTLRYQLLDWQGNPVPTPDFETMAKIMTMQLLPFKFPSSRPQESVVLPSEEDEKAAERRIEEKMAEAEEEDQLEGSLEMFDNIDREVENSTESVVDSTVSTNDGLGVAIGMVVFAATVFYWAWEISRAIP